MSLHMGLIVLAAALVACWGCWWLGRQFPAARRLEEIYGERLQAEYNAGWDQSALAHTELAGQADDDGLTVVLERGRRAVDDDEPARLPSPILDDEGWNPPRSVDEIVQRHVRDIEAGENWYGTMQRELAPEYERPASTTDQFQAVLGKVDGFERECLLTWDSTRRYDRDRPAWLREMGMSDERIRELLGAESITP